MKLCCSTSRYHAFPGAAVHAAVLIFAPCFRPNPGRQRWDGVLMRSVYPLLSSSSPPFSPHLHACQSVHAPNFVLGCEQDWANRKRGLSWMLLLYDTRTSIVLRCEECCAAQHWLVHKPIYSRSVCIRALPKFGAQVPAKKVSRFCARYH